MKRLVTLLMLGGLLMSCGPDSMVYHEYQGKIFGTFFHIKYEYPSGKTLDKAIMEVMQEFNSSLSNYDPNSVISRINANDPDVVADTFFTNCFETGQEISRITNGSFDLTVAPLVNAWGFGFTNKDSVYPEMIDSLLEITGYDKVSLTAGKLNKSDERIMLDASAIAKGYGVDVVAVFLESQGVKNYLVEIGGELRCKGVNPTSERWKVGIEKPIENKLEQVIEAILALSDISMATSGNYRQFYVENGVKYSHTIDPSTGYPVRHSLLSATVLTKDCMSADAYATAFMVMGYDKAVNIINNTPDMEAFLIIANDDGELKTWASAGAQDWVVD